MLSKELLDQVKALNDGDKLALLRTLIDDLALGEHGYDLFAFRGNYQVAQKMLEIIEESEKLKAAPQLEIE